NCKSDFIISMKLIEMDELPPQCTPMRRNNKLQTFVYYIVQMFGVFLLCMKVVVFLNSLSSRSDTLDKAARFLMFYVETVACLFICHYGYIQWQMAIMSVKAFEFVPVIETLQLMGEKAQTKIECIECCGKELFIGTSDSFLVTYSIEEVHDGNGKVLFKTRKTRHKYLELRKPVKCIKAASALNRILVLCDSSILIINMQDMDIIGGGPKLRGVSTFAVNENPNITNPFCIQICVGRKKLLQIYNVTEEKLMHIKDISVPEAPLGLAVDGSHICAALQTKYAVYNFESNSTQQLFTYGCESFHPVIRRIAKEEFLLSAPEGLGMFVNTEGMSNRPPIQWSYSLLALAYSHPYILGLSDEVIMIYSILDQQQKQALPFIGGRIIGNFDGRLYVTSGTAVYSLIPVPWDKQVQEVDTALLKLYAEVNAPELEAFIAAGEITVDVRDCCDWLEKNKCFHSLALLHRHSRDNDKALKVWAKIITGEYEDESFHGLEFFVECLANLKEPELMWRYADFVLSQDEEIGVGIFTLRSTTQPSNDTMKPDTIVDYLHQYPKAVVKYLEHLVLKQNIEAEKFHTHLAVLYLENILKKQREGTNDEALELRMKLRHLLQISNLYRVQLLLSKMSDADLHQETAILYGKIEEHEKALDILVHKLKDFKGAEEYCINNTKDKGIKYKHNLFHALLGVYLDPKLEPDRREEYLFPALEFLNRCAGEFDAAKVLEMIPSNWSISVVEAFLRGALRTSLHKYRMTKIESALARGENLQKRFVLYDLQRHSVCLHENNYCCVCKKPFSDGNFARYPNDVVTHVSCARHNNICPLTGKNFKSLTSLYTWR
ncbi:hypothetical protein L9F63_013516, partial [Diploptera punctata]